MDITITPEMLEQARKKKIQDDAALNSAPDEGFDNICIGCE
jgi:hypothetical protein